jgi:hypothetical protein
MQCTLGGKGIFAYVNTARTVWIWEEETDPLIDAFCVSMYLIHYLQRKNENDAIIQQALFLVRTDRLRSHSIRTKFSGAVARCFSILPFERGT